MAEVVGEPSQLQDDQPPPITRDDEYVHKIIDENVWRKAVHVDGELRWVNNSGGIGDPVAFDRVWKMRSFGEYMLLAPKEEVEEPDTPKKLKNFDPKAIMADDTLTEDERFETLIEYAASMTLNDEPLDEQQPPGEDFRSEIRPRLRKEYLKMQLRRKRHGLPDVSEDGFIAVDIHGNFDIDYANPGPVLKSETQWIDKGYTALKNIDQIAELNKREAKLTEALMPSWKTRYSEEIDHGYESASSEVSQDHCRVSPYYPACGEDCWLKTKHDASEPPEQPKSKAVPISNPGIYEHLELNEMRVLVLESGAGNDEIVCRLQKMGLPDVSNINSVRKDYEALSYTWGDSKRTHAITCNNKLFGVTTNLFEALSYLRDPEADRPIWVDALCINQDDIAERNEQVRQMLTIYQAAIRVVVWLGLPELHGSFAIAAMNHLKVRENRHAIFRKDHDTACLEHLQELVDILDEFFGRPWFTRCWIRQEVSAARFIVVQCGHHRASWNSMKKVANCAWRFREKLRCQGIEVSGGASRPRERSLRYLKRHWVLGQPITAEMGDLRSIWYYHTGSLLELLMVSRLFDATDPRDKVYSILGLAQTPVTTGPTDTSGVLIDYGASTSKIYQHTMKYLINRDQSLDTLCLISTHTGSTSVDLPTWTLDWRVPASTAPLSDNWDYFTYKWGAAGFSKCLVQDQNDLGRLVVEGFPIKRIDELLPLTPTTIPHPPEDPAGDAELYDPSKHVRRFAIADGKPVVVAAVAGENDFIFVLLGCRMPIALRLVDLTNEEVTAVVVGPCFVPMAMFGEELKEFQGDEERTLSRIVLI